MGDIIPTIAALFKGPGDVPLDEESVPGHLLTHITQRKDQWQVYLSGHQHMIDQLCLGGAGKLDEIGPPLGRAEHPRTLGIALLVYAFGLAGSFLGDQEAVHHALF